MVCVLQKIYWKKEMKNKKNILEQKIRKRIYLIIVSQPGICIRELERTLNLGMGQLIYHLSILIKNDIIKEEDDGVFRRFFPSLGNHDWGTGNVNAYFDYFELPGNERYYDFRFEKKNCSGCYSFIPDKKEAN